MFVEPQAWGVDEGGRERECMEQYCLCHPLYPRSNPESSSSSPILPLTSEYQLAQKSKGLDLFHVETDSYVLPIHTDGKMDHRECDNPHHLNTLCCDFKTIFTEM